MTSARLQAAVALILALGLHLGAFALRPGPAGASGSGAGGTDMVSLQAAGPSVLELVAAWDAPPDVSSLQDMAAPPPPEAAPPAPAPAATNDTAPALPALAAEPLATPLADALPQADTAPVPPPPPAVKPRPRPAPPAPVAESRPEQPPPSESSAAQVATGAGGGAVAGDSGQAQAPSLSQARINDLTANWGATIRARIEKRKRYPLAADGASGTVTVRLTITRSGALVDLSVVASSGNAALDAAAIKAVRAAGRFPAAPEGLSQDSTSFTLPMRFAR